LAKIWKKYADYNFEFFFQVYAADDLFSNQLFWSMFAVKYVFSISKSIMVWSLMFLLVTGSQLFYFQKPFSSDFK